MEIIKSVFRSMKIRLVFAVCMALSAVVSVQAVFSLSVSENAEITEAFATSDGIVITEKEVVATARLPYGKNDFYSDAEKILKDIYAILGEDKASYEKDGEKICIKSYAETERYSVSQLVTWSEELQNTYFKCVVDINDDTDVLYVKEMIEGVLNKKDAEYVSYVRINAEKEGAMDEKECRDYVKKVFKRLGAEEVCKGSEGFYAAYGYSKKLTDTITAGDKPVNVQVSLSYNEEKDIMEISLGYPIINTSY